MLKFLVFLALFSFADATLQVPFVGLYGVDDINFNLTIGTPGQTLNVKLSVIIPYDIKRSVDLNLLNKAFYDNGFDSDKSTSFVSKECIKNNCFSYGMNVTETFSINGVVLKEKPFTLYNTFDVKLVNYMSISRYATIFDGMINKTTFVESVLRDQREEILVLAFDNIQQKFGKHYTGQLIFGERPSSCKNDWAYMPEISFTSENQWRFDVDKISIGKYSFLNPFGTRITVGQEYLFLYKEIYNQTMKALGSIDYKTIPCSTKTDIIYRLGGKDFRISSEFYMIPSENEGQQNCKVRISNEDDSSLPITVFSNHCLMFDYKNKRVGFTQKV